MKRRDFITSTADAGLTGALAQGYSTMVKNTPSAGPGFDVHPFLKNHPEAVFIHHTQVASKLDTEGARSTGAELARQLLVKTSSGGYPESTRIIIKPNWTGAGPKDGHPVIEKLGCNTDQHFVGGWAEGMREGPGRRTTSSGRTAPPVSGRTWGITDVPKNSASTSGICPAWTCGNWAATTLIS